MSRLTFCLVAGVTPLVAPTVAPRPSGDLLAARLANGEFPGVGRRRQLKYETDIQGNHTRQADTPGRHARHERHTYTPGM